MRADENHLFCEDDFRFAYDWIVDKMEKEGLKAPTGVLYPVWAWYQWEGKRKRRDMRESGHAKRGEKIVQLTIEVQDKDVFLSDFDLFHYVLGYMYLPEDEKDSERFEKQYMNLGFSCQDLQNFSIQTQNMKDIRAQIVNSWNRIFHLEREDENYIYGRNDTKSIQATFWELKLEQVIKSEIFIAK